MKKTPLDFTDRVRVVANVHDLDTNKYSIEVEFRDIHGNWSRARLPRSIIRSGVNASNELLDRGANIPTGVGAGAQLASLLSAIPDRTYRITGKTGWRDQSFVLPDITIGPDADTRSTHHCAEDPMSCGALTDGPNDGMADVMTITKCLIPVPTVSGFTVPPRELSQRGHTSDGWSALAWWRKIMSKTSNATRERELTEAELDHVAGGTPSIPIPPPIDSYAIGRIEPRFPPLF